MSGVRTTLGEVGAGASGKKRQKAVLSCVLQTGLPHGSVHGLQFLFQMTVPVSTWAGHHHHGPALPPLPPPVQLVSVLAAECTREDTRTRWQACLASQQRAGALHPMAVYGSPPWPTRGACSHFPRVSRAPLLHAAPLCYPVPFYLSMRTLLQVRDVQKETGQWSPLATSPGHWG